jgi:hypothetical protein
LIGDTPAGYLSTLALIGANLVFDRVLFNSLSDLVIAASTVVAEGLVGRFFLSSLLMVARFRYARVVGMKEDTVRRIGFTRLAIFRPEFIVGNAQLLCQQFVDGLLHEYRVQRAANKSGGDDDQQTLDL